MSRYVNKLIHKQSGMVLMLVLIFLEIFGMLSVRALQNCVLEKRITNNQFNKLFIFSSAQQIIKMAETHLEQSENVTCSIPVTPVYDLLHKSLDWWQSGISCTGNFNLFQYYYVIEFLGSDPCALIEHGDNPQQNADYFRITLLTTNYDTLGARIFLQTTLIKAGKAKLACLGSRHAVSKGRQSWRELQ